MARAIASSCAAVTSAIGRKPICGKMSASSLAIICAACFGTDMCVRVSCHSRATGSDEFLDVSRRMVRYSLSRPLAHSVSRCQTTASQSLGNTASIRSLGYTKNASQFATGLLNQNNPRWPESPASALWPSSPKVSTNCRAPSNTTRTHYPGGQMSLERVLANMCQ